MNWLNQIADELIARHPKGEIVVSSGVSPSGIYHLGTLREVMTAEAINYELRRRGRKARHIHVVDDLDVFRKVPATIPDSYEKHLGKPLCDIPAPEGKGSYADYYLNGLLEIAEKLHLKIEILRAHEKYREGFFTEAIETALAKADVIKQNLESISGHKLGDNWSVVQVVEDGYLKNREFVRLEPKTKTLIYKDNEGKEREANYKKGEVKLNWRVDWPARWWLLKVNAEPFGRDHATKGGSYDTGEAIVQQVFGAPAPLPLPYNFVNISGETKKMSKSAGNVISATDLLRMLPSEVVWYFLLRFSPDKLLFFDQGPTMIRLVDEFAELLAKKDKTDEEKQLLDMCLHDTKPTVSNIPFSHLVASYQAALKDTSKALEIIKRTEYAPTVTKQEETIKAELKFIDEWLKNSAPEDVKFELLEKIDPSKFEAKEKKFLMALAEKISKASDKADGDWFHKAIYDLKDELKMEPKEMFQTLYQVLIGKDSGPRAGWFLSMLPREWLLERLNLNK